MDNTTGLSVDIEGSDGDRIAAIVCREGILAVEAQKASCPDGKKVELVADVFIGRSFAE